MTEKAAEFAETGAEIFHDHCGTSVIKIMEKVLKEAVWNQFGASINALENALEKCPAEL